MVENPEIRKILFTTDFSECSETPKRFAVFLAQSYKAELLVMHVIERAAIGAQAYFENIPITPIYDQLKNNVEIQMSKQFTKEEHDAVSITEIIEHGNTVQAITDCAQEAKADIIVMGTHGRCGLNHAIMGSVAEKVVRSAPCPVLTIRNTGMGPRIQNVLFSTDFSEYSFSALPYAIEIARKFRAKLHQVYVIEPFSYDPLNPDRYFPDDKLFEYVENSAHDLFQTLSKVSNDRGVEITQEVIAGLSPHQEILSYVNENLIDLVVMATRGRSGLKYMLLGSTTERIIRLAPCPVLSVKTFKDSTSKIKTSQ